MTHNFHLTTVYSQYNTVIYDTVMTEKEHLKATRWLRFELIITGDPYLALTVELWVSCYEYYGKRSLRYNRPRLYLLKSN